MELLSSVPVGRIGFGGVLGACAASTLKKWTRDVAYGVGMGLIALQALSHYGLVTVHWEKVRDCVTGAVDTNGDKKVDQVDVRKGMSRVVAFLGAGIPDTAGFAVGFAAGLQWL